MKLKKRINISLVIIIIVIYGLVVLKVIDYFNSNSDNTNLNAAIDEDASMVSTSKQSKLNSNNLFELKTLSNDPFTFAQIRRVKDTVKIDRKIVKKEPVSVSLLQFKINGIIINNDSKMITLVDLSNNSTVFLREGEKYSTIKIKSISKDKVEVVENGTAREIEIQR